MEKVSVFIKIRVLFWPEISALGVLFNFDNEGMRPPKYPSVIDPSYLLRLFGVLFRSLPSSVNVSWSIKQSKVQPTS